MRRSRFIYFVEFSLVGGGVREGSKVVGEERVEGFWYEDDSMFWNREE